MNKMTPAGERVRYPEPRKGSGVFGSDLMVDMLDDMGAEYVFLNPGSSFRGLHDSLVNYHGNTAPEIVLVTHEMIAVAMAHGYWKATRKPAVVMLHNLVGLMSGSMAIFNAFCDQVPLLIYGGSGPADPKERRFIDWAHSANAQGDLVRSFVKWTDEPATLEGTLDSMLRAQRKAHTAPMGPVYVSIDAGQQEQDASDVKALDPNAPRYQAPAPIYPHPDQIKAAVEMLIAANQPLIIGGRIGLHPEVTPLLKRMVELLGAGYMDDRAIIASLPTRHPHNLNGDKKFRGMADVLICFDVQDVTSSTGGYGANRSSIMGAGAAAEGAKVIDVSLSDYFGNSWTRFGGPTPPTDLQIAADPRLALQALVDELERRADDIKSVDQRSAVVQERHNALFAKREETLKRRWDETPISLERVTHELYQTVKKDDWVLTVRNHRTWADGYWEIEEAGQYLGGDGGGGVGYGAGAAVGAALGLKGSGKLPVAMIGDGDFMMTPGAIWSGMHHKVPLLLVLLNNRSWGNDELHQREIAEMRGRSPQTAHIGQTTREPDADLTGIARSFGAHAIGPINDPGKLAEAFAQAAEVVRAGGLAVVEVITSLD